MAGGVKHRDDPPFSLRLRTHYPTIALGLYPAHMDWRSVARPGKTRPSPVVAASSFGSSASCSQSIIGAHQDFADGEALPGEQVGVAHPAFIETKFNQPA